MMIAVPPAEWTRHFASLSAAELALILKMLAAKVTPDRFRKNVRGPKKPPPKRTSAKRHPHVSHRLHSCPTQTTKKPRGASLKDLVIRRKKRDS